MTIIRIPSDSSCVYDETGYILESHSECLDERALELWEMMTVGGVGIRVDKQRPPLTPFVIYTYPNGHTHKETLAYVTR